MIAREKMCWNMLNLIAALQVLTCFAWKRKTSSKWRMYRSQKKRLRKTWSHCRYVFSWAEQRLTDPSMIPKINQRKITSMWCGVRVRLCSYERRSLCQSMYWLAHISLMWSEFINCNIVFQFVVDVIATRFLFAGGRGPRHGHELFARLSNKYNAPNYEFVILHEESDGKNKRRSYYWYRLWFSILLSLQWFDHVMQTICVYRVCVATKSIRLIINSLPTECVHFECAIRSHKRCKWIYSKKFNGNILHASGVIGKLANRSSVHIIHLFIFVGQHEEITRKEIVDVSFVAQNRRIIPIWPQTNVCAIHTIVM